MKKIFFFPILLGAAVILSSCAGEEDDLFSQSAAERLAQSQKTYTELFAKPSAGWVMEYYPTNNNSAPKGLGYLLLANFSTDRSVTMAMNNDMSNNSFLTEKSVWEVISDNGPVLSFNSYNNCLHRFCDPAIYDEGLGYEGDYEFVVLNLKEDADEAMVKGKKRGTYIRLLQLPEGVSQQDYLKDVIDFQKEFFPSNAINMPILNVKDSLFYMSDMGSGLPSIYPKGKDAIAFEDRHPYLIVKHGDKYELRFRDKLSKKMSDDTEVSYQLFVYNPETERFEDEGGCFIEATNANRFFEEWLGNRHKWAAKTTLAMSDNYKTAFTTLVDDLAAASSKYKLESAQLRWLADNASGTETFVFEMAITYGKNKRATLDYVFDFNASDNGVQLNYKEPYNSAAEAIINAVPSLGAFLNLLSGSFVVSGVNNNYVLNSVKLSADADSWIVLDNAK